MNIFNITLYLKGKKDNSFIISIKLVSFVKLYILTFFLYNLNNDKNILFFESEIIIH